MKNKKMKPRGKWATTGENPFLLQRTYRCVICKKMANKITPFITKTCSDLCSKRLTLDIRKRHSRKQYYTRKISEALDNYQIDKENNCVSVKFGKTVYYEKLSRPELLENEDLIEQFIVNKNIKEQIEYDIFLTKGKF